LVFGSRLLVTATVGGQEGAVSSCEKAERKRFDRAAGESGLFLWTPTDLSWFNSYLTITVETLNPGVRKVVWP